MDSEFRKMYQCDKCSYKVTSSTNDVCPHCGDLKSYAYNSIVQLHNGWNAVVVRWIPTVKWWNPSTWGSGKWEYANKEDLK